MRRTERIRALQLSAGALFPEEAPAQQKRDQALERLRQLVRVAPSASLPRDITWSGLDELLRKARASTFGVSASPREQITLTGPDEAAEIEVVTSRPAALSLWLEPIGGGPGRRLDTAAVVDHGTLRFKVLKAGRPDLATGDYSLTVIAIDNSAPDTIRLAYATKVTAPALTYVEVPGQLDAGGLLPEKTRPHRVGGVIAGVLMFAGTVATARVFRDNALKDGAANDGRAVAVGLVLGLGTAGGVFALDKGAPIPVNIAANQKTRFVHAQEISEALARNAELLRTYHAEITINPEVRP